MAKPNKPNSVQTNNKSRSVAKEPNINSKNRQKMIDPDFAGKKAVKKPNNKKPAQNKNTGAKRPSKRQAPQKQVMQKAGAKKRKNFDVIQKPARGKKNQIKIVEKPSVKFADAPKKDVDSESKKAEEPELAPQPEQKVARHPMPGILKVLLSTILLALAAILFTWFIFWRQNLCDADAAMEFINQKPILAAYSWLVIFLLMAVVAAATWRVFATIGISFSVISIITYLHIQKMMVRAAPLLPDDFQLADQVGDLAGWVDPWSIVRLVAGVIFVMAGSLFLQRAAHKVWGLPKKKLPLWEEWQIVPRAALTLLALAMLTIVTNPVVQHENPEWIEDLEYVGWNQTENYEKNGFIIGFMHNLRGTMMDEPENYNEETMRQIAKKYQDLKAADKTERKALSDVAENIVVILNESFYDPEILTEYYEHTGGDVLPNWRKILQETPSGYMYSPEYGGSTSNVEFAVQTGLTTFWSNGFPYIDSIPKMDNLLGVAAVAKAAGFNTTAIHSYDGTMYKRNLVYPVLGYNDFYDENTISHQDRENQNGYISDQSIFNEAIDILKQDGPQMVGVVTMQNHAPYNIANYPELDFSLTAMDNSLLEANFQSLHKSDEYLGEFLAEIDELDKPTVVLMFGDHASGILDSYAKSSDPNEQNLAHVTPYFIYANFDIESPYSEEEVAEMNSATGIDLSEKVESLSLPMVSPNCLQNILYDVLGVEKPAMFYLVNEVCKEVPILAGSYYSNGKKLPEETVLNEYKLLTYDALVGKKYWDGE